MLREIRSIMETRQYQRDASASVNNSTTTTANDNNNNASPDGGTGRPLFTPRVAMGCSSRNGAGSRGGSQLFHSNNGVGAGAAGTPRGTEGVFPTPTPRRRGRGSGVSPAGGVSGAAGGGASGIADYRLMDNTGGPPSFAAGSPGDMSIAMSVASDDDILLTSPRRSRSSTAEGGGAAGFDGSSEAGGGDAEGGGSFSDFLSP